MTIYDRIKARRIQLGLSQTDLAKKLGYKHKSSIAYIERGKNDLSQSKIVLIADALDVSPLWLLDGDETSAPAPKELTVNDLPEDVQKLVNLCLTRPALASALLNLWQQLPKD